MIAGDKSKRYLTLISIKDNGGLVYPSKDIVKIDVTCDKFFKRYVQNQRNLEAQLTNIVLYDINGLGS